jgi:hypothetical protein
MFAIVVLVPGLLLGAIAWGVVGALRQRGREEFTQATAAALYAQVMVVAGVLATLAGAGLVVKLLLSLIDPAYSYFVPEGAIAGSFGPPSVQDQHAQDLIVAAMLAGIGLLVAGGHSLLARFLAGLRGGSPAWIVRGTPDRADRPDRAGWLPEPDLRRLLDAGLLPREQPDLGVRRSGGLGRRVRTRKDRAHGHAASAAPPRRGPAAVADGRQQVM